ncbi:MAG: tetratricopeptide repeat protein [Asgard group archaeon]|nr:tetratricopeptide repeat protein [Asgard group archaeon]
MGNVYEKKNDRVTAYEYKIKAVALNPENSYAWDALGLNYSLTKQLDKAIACLKRAIEISPMNQLARSNLEYALRERSKQ